MALLIFGQTARSNDSFAFQNTSTAFPSSSLVFALLRSATLAPGHFKFLTFSYFDELLRGVNLHHNSPYSVNSNGVSPYLDDVAELCKLIKSGQLTVYAACSSPAGSGSAFTANTALASANVGGFTLGQALGTSFIGGDGSVTF
jgi:hypothetical protein